MSNSYMTQTAKVLRHWSKQFETLPDNTRVTLRAGDLKMFARFCVGILEAFDGQSGGGGSHVAATHLALVRRADSGE